MKYWGWKKAAIMTSISRVVKGLTSGLAGASIGPQGVAVDGAGFEGGILAPDCSGVRLHKRDRPRAKAVLRPPRTVKLRPVSAKDPPQQ
jgi:hypothetical protein